MDGNYERRSVIVRRSILQMRSSPRSLAAPSSSWGSTIAHQSTSRTRHTSSSGDLTPLASLAELHNQGVIEHSTWDTLASQALLEQWDTLIGLHGFHSQEQRIVAAHRLSVSGLISADLKAKIQEGKLIPRAKTKKKPKAKSKGKAE